MKSLPVVLLSLLLSSAALAQTSTWYYEARMTGDSPEPTGNPALLEPSPSRPLNLAGARRFRVTVCTVAGELDGGFVNIMFYHPNVGGSGRWIFSGDFQVFLPSGTGRSCYFYTYETPVRVGWIAPVTVNVATVPAGSDIIVRIDPDSV